MNAEDPDQVETAEEEDGSGIVVHSAAGEILRLNAVMSKANGLAGELAAYAKTGGIPGARPNAARLLYYLTRNLTNELRQLFEVHPEWFDGLEDSHSEDGGLNIRLKAGHLANDEKRLHRIGMATIRLISRWRALDPFPRDYRPGEFGNPEPVIVEIPAELRGAGFSSMVKKLGLREASRLLPPPTGDRDSDAFKAWWQVAWPIYMASKMRARKGKTLAKGLFEGFKSSYQKPLRIERERVKQGILAGMAKLSGG